MTTAEDFWVGDWLLHPSRNRLTHGDKIAALQPRFMDLLVYLAQRPGKVVSKDEILDAVWAKEFVAEGTLTHAVAVIRQTLGDDVRNPQYIETIPTRGYRLIAAIRPAHPAPDLAPPPPSKQEPLAAPAPASPGSVRPARRAVVAVGLVALVVAAVIGFRLLAMRRPVAPGDSPSRIVVLPFQNLGPAERDYLAQGITDDITTRLAAGRGLGVISRTTATYCARTAKSAPQISEELGVNYILEGTVRWEQDRQERNELRINAQLIRAADDTLLWGESYRVGLASVVDVGATIASRVVKQLGLPVRGPEQSRLAARPTDNSDAYQAYLCGLRYHDLESREQLGLATAMFERAVSLDPSFALAYAELSLVHSRVYHLGLDASPGRMSEAERSAARALALRPELPEAHLAVAAVDHFVKRDFAHALEEYHLAQRDLPNDSGISALIADVHRRQGKWSEARAELEKAVAADPGNYDALVALGDTLSPLRAYGDADQAYKRASNLSPDRIDPYVRRFWNYLRWDGSTDRAERVLKEAPLPDHPFVLYCRSYLAYLRRDFRHALAILAGAGDQPPIGPFRLPAKPLQECLYLDAAGDEAAAARSCADALRTLKRDVANAPTRAWPWLEVALAEASLGRTEAAVDQAARATELCPVSTDAYDGAYCLLEQAQVLARVGRAAQAAAILKHLLLMPSPLSAGWLRLDPRWDRVRNDPVFATLEQGETTAGR